MDAKGACRQEVADDVGHVACAPPPPTTATSSTVGRCTGVSDAGSSQRYGAAGEPDHEGRPGLSAASDAGTDFGTGPFHRHHRQGWQCVEYSAGERTPAASRRGDGRGEAICLQADPAQWESGGSHYAGGCQFCSRQLMACLRETVTIPFITVGVPCRCLSAPPARDEAAIGTPTVMEGICTSRSFFDPCRWR